MTRGDTVKAIGRRAETRRGLVVKFRETWRCVVELFDLLETAYLSFWGEMLAEA